MRIDVLALKGPAHFSIKDIKEGLETLIEKALFEIRDEVVTVIINLDNKQISTFQTKDYKNAKLEFEGHSLIKHYLESIENQKNTYICNFKSYPEKEVIPFVEALKQFLKIIISIEWLEIILKNLNYLLRKNIMLLKLRV